MAGLQTANGKVQDGWELTTFSVTNYAKAILGEAGGHRNEAQETEDRLLGRHSAFDIGVILLRRAAGKAAAIGCAHSLSLDSYSCCRGLWSKFSHSGVCSAENSSIFKRIYRSPSMPGNGSI